MFLTASYVVPEHGPLYDSMDLKDGIVILEEQLLQVIRDENVHILLSGDFNARTGCKQQKLDDMSNYMPGSEEDVIIRGDWADRRSKDIVVNNFAKSLLNLYLCLIVLFGMAAVMVTVVGNTQMCHHMVAVL